MFTQNRQIYSVFFVAVFVLGGLFLGNNFAYAQEAIEENVSDSKSVPEPWFAIEGLPGGGAALGDFVVGPGKVELEIAPGESKTIMMSVSNRIGKTHTFILEIEDIQGSTDPSKTVELLGDARGPYTLKDYVHISGDTIELDHNQRAQIPVTISIPSDAEPGGMYGSVLFKTVAIKGSNGSGDIVSSQSPIIARIGTLFFVTIPGEIERDGKLIDFGTVPAKPWFEKGPIAFEILYENNI